MIKIKNKKRFFISLFLIIVFTFASYLDIQLFSSQITNNTQIVEAKVGSSGGFKSGGFKSSPSKSSSGNFKSGSFSSPSKSNSSSGSKSSSGDFKSGNFSKPNSSTENNKGSTNSQSSYDSGSSKRSFFPIPIPFFSGNPFSRTYYGSGHSLFGSIFGIIILIIVIFIIIKIIKKIIERKYK